MTSFINSFGLFKNAGKTLCLSLSANAALKMGKHK